MCVCVPYLCMYSLFFLSLVLPGWGGDEVGVQVLHSGRDLSSVAVDRVTMVPWFM